MLTTILVLGIGLLSYSQTRQLTGKVLGPDNLGVVSASVKVKGSASGTSTNSEGAFSLTVPSGDIVLEITSVGFAKRDLAVGASQNNIMINLSQDATQMSDIVVTAQGISKQSRKLGYSVTTVSGDLLTQARENNVGNSLSGRVAGLKVSSTSSGPQGTTKLLLRGNPSINSSGAPLFVINGVPMDNTQRGSAGEWGGGDNGDGIGNLNPDDIENMTVLKGQSASALYGSRASNGVILITTKTGKKNEFGVEYNMNYMMEDALDFTDYQYEYGQGVGGLKPTTAIGARNAARFSWGGKLDGSQVIQFDGKSYPYSAYKNNIENFYRQGSSLTNTIALSKGGENGSFRLSYSNLGNESILRNSGMQRNTFTLNVQQNISKKLSATVFAQYIDQKNNNVPYLSDGPLNANNGLFLANNIDQNILNPGYDPVTGKEIQFSDDEYVSNPWFVVNQFVNDQDRKRLLTAATLKYNFTSWLYAQARMGYDLINDRGLNVTPWGTAYSQGAAGGLGNQSKSELSEYNIDGLIGATHKLTSSISLDAAIGGNMRKNKYESVSISGGPFILPYLYTIGNVTNRNTGYGYSAYQVNSAYYTVDFSYRNFLTLGTTGRYDAYSTLPDGNNTIFVPSVNASFIFSEFTDLGGILNFGKLRASWAKTSNELTTPYQTQVYYNLGNSYLGQPVGSFPTSLPSGLLKPFTTEEFEVGADLRFFGSRLNVDIAYYTKKTQNEVMSAQYSITSGYTSGYVPTGSMKNNGLELLISGTPIRSKNFSWNVSFNFTNVKNEVVKTDVAGNRINLGQNRATLGNAITAYVVGLPGPQIMAYDYKYDSKGEMIVDASGYPVRGDLIPMGSVLPTTYGGLNNEFNFKGFSFSFLFDYSFGNKILSATSYYSIFRGLNKMTLEGRETGITKGVTSTGATNTVAADAQGYYRSIAQNITKTHVLDGDFIKLRQLSLGYSLPASILKSLKYVSGVQIALVGRNLWTVMKNSDNIDPEATFGSNVRYYGIEGTNLPTTRSYGVNLNIKFKN
ncbi:MAG TPA: SusC/RagA family TonB-linked outer membrane protein [Chitinophagaceae bacterium]|nr:SusC/RagA family TonB-linked outer membrane protein [Chitinophagaceae bacterium]